MAWYTAGREGTKTPLSPSTFTIKTTLRSIYVRWRRCGYTEILTTWNSNCSNCWVLLHFIYFLPTGNASGLLRLQNCPLKSCCRVYLHQKQADVARLNTRHRWSTNQRRCWWQHPRFHASPAALASAETPGRRRWSAWDAPPCEQYSQSIRSCVQRWCRQGSFLGSRPTVPSERWRVLSRQRAHRSGSRPPGSASTSLTLGHHHMRTSSCH